MLRQFLTFIIEKGKHLYQFKYRLLLAFSIAIFTLSGVNARAETTIYKYRSKSGVVSFSGIEPIGLDYQQIRFDCYACQPDSLINWRKAKLYLSEYSQAIHHAATQHQIDPALVRAIIHAESHFNPTAVSKQGALGLMQLMPETAAWLGVKDPLVARQNIQGGVKHLARLVKKYRGNISLASAAYNAGETTIKKYGGIPPYPETQVYVERVDILLKRYQQEYKKASYTGS